VSRIVAIGELMRLAGFSLVGVEVQAAEDAQAARAAWESLGPGVGLVIVTPAAAEVLEDELEAQEDVLWVSLPE
jgi:vacuolar-type H+-ATPase subunit F/Vma7